MELRYQTYDQEIYSVNSADVQDILPYDGVLRMPLSQEPYQGLLMRKGQVIPVLGPIPENIKAESAPYDDRPWVIIYSTHAQVVFGLPQIFEPAAS